MITCAFLDRIMLTMISKLGFCLDLIYNLLFDFLFENLFLGLKIMMAI
jgi:hypothetical protein